MLKRIAAIGFIFLCSTIAWMVLAASIAIRTNSSGEKSRLGVASTWGTPQQQIQPTALLEESNPPNAPPTPIVNSLRLDAERTRVHTDLALEFRQKGLLWYSTYVVQFSGAYVFRNPGSQPRVISLAFALPAEHAVYDDLRISAAGEPLSLVTNQNLASASLPVPAGQTVEFLVVYRSRGLESWRYNFGKNVPQTKDFELTMTTNFKEIDFPANTLSPVSKQQTSRGWDLTWRYRNLISGFEIGMAMPQKLQPGPLAGEISTFAPVSLLLFFFVLILFTTLRKVELHPMNYFFLAAAFFSFHLLLAYSVDHISIQLAFVISSLVSVGLVFTYLRIVVGPRFAAQAGLAQFVYLVLFSFTFFLKGATGLSITIGCIATLYLAMQATARIQWLDLFAARNLPS